MKLQEFNVSLRPNNQYNGEAVVHRGDLLDLSDIYGYDVSLKVTQVVRGFWGTLQLFVVRYFFSHQWVPITLVSRNTAGDAQHEEERILVNVSNIKEQLDIDLSSQGGKSTYTHISDLISQILSKAEQKKAQQKEICENAWKEWTANLNINDRVTSLETVKYMVSQEDIDRITHKLYKHLNDLEAGNKSIKNMHARHVAVIVSTTEMNGQKSYKITDASCDFSVHEQWKTSMQQTDIDPTINLKKKLGRFIKDICKVSSTKTPDLLQTVAIRKFSHIIVG